MKCWVKTGILAVGVYIVIFGFNFFFLRSIPDNLIIRIVNVPVYFLLQLFGVVSPGDVFYIGVLTYFLLGVLLFFLARCLDNVTSKYNFLKEVEGPEVTKKSMGVDKK